MGPTGLQRYSVNMSTSSWIGLAGVGVGFLLGEGSRYARYRLDIRRNKQLVRAELKSLLSQIPQKRDILNQAAAHLRSGRFMPTMSVHSITTGYYSVLESLYPHLPLIERNCLHVIFERIRVVDDLMDNLEDLFTKAMKDQIFDAPTIYSERIDELLESLNVVENLSISYLARSPIDVFSVGNPKK